MIINLKQLLKKRRISQIELSNATGLSPMLINRMCSNSTKRLPTEALDKICDYLKVEINELLTVERESK